jgi:hypothetical protein
MGPEGPELCISIITGTKPEFSWYSIRTHLAGIVGAIKIKTATVGGRTVKTPVVEYEQIEFDLKAA